MTTFQVKPVATVEQATSDVARTLKRPISLTRRAALWGALTSSAALAVPAAAVAAVEHPWIKARRLAKELSATLAECDGGMQIAVIQPKGSTSHPVLFWDREYYGSLRYMSEERVVAEASEPIARAKYHARVAQQAMNELNPGKWMVNVSSEDDWILIRRDPVWVPTEIPGLSVPGTY